MSRPLRNPRRIRREPVFHSASVTVEQLENRVLFSRLVGLDVSTYQPNVNWASVKSAGKDFAIIRASAGLNTVDDQFAHNTSSTAGAQAKGLYSGFYHYAYYDLSGHTAVGEADHFWSVVKNKIVANGKTLMPMLDIEEPLPSGWTATTLSNWINAWCNEVKAKALSEKGLSLTPIVYMNASTAGNSNKINSTVAMNWPLVVAQWPGGTVNTQSGEPSSTGFWQDWAFWQYADNGHVAGVGNGTTTNVDLDVFNGDAKVIRDFIIASQGRWADGTWVRVNTSSGLKAWNAPTSSTLSPYNDTYSVIPNGTYGQILSGPVYGNGYMRWRIQYSNGVIGWSAEPFLISATPSGASSPNPGNNVLLRALPASFTWTATHASSYHVYVDNVLDAVVTNPSWSHPAIADGAHTWRIDSINDGIVTTGSTWRFTLDGTPPTAAYGGQTPVTGSSSFNFTITYSDPVSGLDSLSLDNSDLTVIGPNGYSSPATFVSLSGNVATYQVPAPMGVWDLRDNGTYSIYQIANQVKDIAGNGRASGYIGSFNASAPFAYLSGRMLHIDYMPGVQQVILGSDGSGALTASESNQTLAFSSGAIDNIVINGQTDFDNLATIAQTLEKPLTFQGETGKNSIEVQSGVSQSFTSDAGADSPNLALIVDTGGVVLFSASQHLGELVVNGSAKVQGGSGITLVTQTLDVTGALDLGSNNLIVPNGAAGNFNGGGYDGMSGLVESGYAGASGIYSSDSDSTHRLAIATAANVLGLSGSATGTWQGETVDAASVLVRYTYGGDANLDGKVNIDDYGRIDSNVGQSGSVFGWYNGDFNLDGKINIDDYGIIDSIIGAQGPPIT